MENSKYRLKQLNRNKCKSILQKLLQLKTCQNLDQGAIIEYIPTQNS